MMLPVRRRSVTSRARTRSTGAPAESWPADELSSRQCSRANSPLMISLIESGAAAATLSSKPMDRPDRSGPGRPSNVVMAERLDTTFRISCDR